MIGGEEYTVRSDLSPEYTREVAAYLDQALEKVLSQGPLVETHKAAMLAAKEELMAVRENLHKSLDEKLAGVDRREQELRKLDQQLQDRTKALSKREQESEQKISARLEQVAGLSAQDAKAELVSRIESE